MLYVLSEFSLLAGALLILFGALFTHPSQRFCFSVAKTSVVLSALFAVLFYNKVLLQNYFIISVGTTLVFALTCALTLVCFILASKWFALHKDYAAHWFCFDILLLLFSLKLMMQTTHLGILFCCTVLFCFLQIALFAISRPSEELYHTGRKYFFVSLIFIALFSAVLLCLKGQNMQYDAIGEYLLTSSSNINAFISSGILCVLLFLLGAAPFHFWRTDRIAPLILPVATYFELIPVLPIWVLFFKLTNTLLVGFAENLHNVLFVFGLLSILVGIIGANASRFITKIFTSAGLYQTGVILLIFSTLKPNVFPFCLMYTELYLYILLGIYICLYAIKSGGEHLNNLSMIRGLFTLQPYVSGTFVFLVMTLIGLPPLLLLLSQFMMFMTVAKYPLVIYITLFGAVMFVPVFLKIIQTVCFTPREKNFDRPDFAIYAGLLIYFLLFLMMNIKPHYILIQETVLSGRM